MEKKKIYLLSIGCLWIGILLGFAIYKGAEYYQEKQNSIMYTEKVYTYFFGDDNQLNEDCKKKYLHKGETYTMTEVTTQNYVCKCLPNEIRVILNDKEAKENYEKFMVLDNAEGKAQVKEFLMETAGIICRDEIEQYGLIEAEKKYGKLDFHVE